MLMFMVDPGWESEDGTPAGESHLLRWRDAVAEFRKRFPDTAEDDLRILTGTQVAYKPWYVADPPAVEPLLSILGNNDWTARYWDSMVDVDKTKVYADDAKPFCDAVRRFDSVVQSNASIIRLRLARNDVIIFDNTRVAHGRAAFPDVRTAPDSTIEHNTRRLWTVHVEAAQPRSA
jgi:hypothetical protein